MPKVPPDDNGDGPSPGSEDTSVEKAIQRQKYKFNAPDFQRRKLIFDSLSKLPQSRKNGIEAKEDVSKGTLLYAWGAGYHGQLGSNSVRKKCQRMPQALDFHEPVLQISCGGFHNAVVSATGRVYTWGFSSALVTEQHLIVNSDKNQMTHYK